MDQPTSFSKHLILGASHTLVKHIRELLIILTEVILLYYFTFLCLINDQSKKLNSSHYTYIYALTYAYELIIEI